MTPYTIFLRLKCLHEIFNIENAFFLFRHIHLLLAFVFETTRNVGSPQFHPTFLQLSNSVSALTVESANWSGRKFLPLKGLTGSLSDHQSAVL